MVYVLLGRLRMLVREGAGAEVVCGVVWCGMGVFVFAGEGKNYTSKYKKTG